MSPLTYIIDVVSIKINSILSCSVISSELAVPKRRKQYNLVVDPYYRPILYIEVNNGDQYVLSAKDPDTACNLINTALATRDSKEPEK